MPLPAAPLSRRRGVAQTGHRTPPAVVLAAALVLGLVGGWVAGLVRVRTP